jgi:hypothetical protein
VATVTAEKLGQLMDWRVWEEILTGFLMRRPSFSSMTLFYEEEQHKTHV